MERKQNNNHRNPDDTTFDFSSSSNDGGGGYRGFDSVSMFQIQTMMFGLDRLSINDGFHRDSNNFVRNRMTITTRMIGENSINNFAAVENRLPMQSTYGNRIFEENRMASSEIPEALIDDGCDFVSKWAMTKKGCDKLRNFLAEEDGGVMKEMIITKMIADLPIIMVHQIGFEFAKTVFDCCDEQQMSRIFQSIVVGNELSFVHICCSNYYGMEAVKVLIVNLKTKVQVLTLTNVLINHIVTFTNCCHGQQLLEFFIQACNDDFSKKLIFNAMAKNCTAIARNRMGCIVLQHCICPTYMQGDYLVFLLNSIIINSLFLAEDRYGNYVVQHVMEMGIEKVIRCIVERLKGQFSDLAKSKYGSNVVEKCLKVCEVNEVVKIIDELSNSIQLLSIAQHPFGNYVLQSALKQARRRQGTRELYRDLVKRINVYTSILQTHSYGRIVLYTIHKLNTNFFLLQE